MDLEDQEEANNLQEKFGQKSFINKNHAVVLQDNRATGNHLPGRPSRHQKGMD